MVATTAYMTLITEHRALGGALVCLCFFFGNVQLSWTDLMIEATYTEKMRRAPEHSADIVSFVWCGIGFFGLLGIFVAGPGIDLFGPIPVLALAIPFAAGIIVPALMGWMTEERAPPGPRGLGLQSMGGQWKYFTCTLVLTLGVLCTMVSGLLQIGSVPQAVLALVVSLLTGLPRRRGRLPIGCVRIRPLGGKGGREGRTAEKWRRRGR